MVLPGAVAPRPEIAGEPAAGVKELDAVVAPVGHYDQVAGRRPGYIVRLQEPPWTRAARAELEGELAVGGAKNLDAVVVQVGDGDQVSRRGVRDGRGLVELPVAGAGRAELEGERGVVGGYIENLDAVISLVDGGNASAVRRPGYRHGCPERAVGGGAAQRAERKGERAVRMVHLDAVVIRVGHGERPRQADAGRRRVGIGRRVGGKRRRRPSDA